MTRKPTSAGAFGVPSRAFGSAKPSPSPSKLSDKSNSSSILGDNPPPAKPILTRKGGQTGQAEEIDEANSDEYGDEM